MKRLALVVGLMSALCGCDELECRELGYTPGAEAGRVCESTMSLFPEEAACTDSMAAEVASMEENFWTGYCDEHLAAEAADGVGCGTDGVIACERSGL